MRRSLGIFSSGGASTPAFTAAAGLTTVETNTYRYYVFTSSGNYTLNRTLSNCHIIAVGGGGGGGRSSTSTTVGAGGGGGGSCIYVVDTITGGVVNILIGAGGTGQTSNTAANATNGGDTIIYSDSSSGGTATFVGKYSPYYTSISKGYAARPGGMGGGVAQSPSNGTDAGNMATGGGGHNGGSGGTASTTYGGGGGSATSGTHGSGGGGGGSFRNLTYAEPALSQAEASSTGGSASGSTTLTAYSGSGGQGFMLHQICLDTTTGGGFQGPWTNAYGYVGNLHRSLGYGGGGSGGTGTTNSGWQDYEGNSYQGGGSYAYPNGQVKSGGGGHGGRKAGASDGGNGGSGVIIIRELI